MNPFQAHAKAISQIQAILGETSERTSGAVLLMFKTKVPCSHSPVMNDFDLGPGGPSPKLFIEQVEFLASDIGNAKPKKGVKCLLTIRPGTEPLRLQLWEGGLMPGGYLYRFKAVDENYQA